MRQAPLIAFLGFVERSAQVQDRHPRLWKYNILGLKHHIFSIIYPFTFGGGGLAVAVYDPQPSDSFKLVWRSDSGFEVGMMDITLADKTIEVGPETALTHEMSPVLRKDGPLVMIPPGGWAFAVLPTATTNLTFNAPGIYHLYLRTDDGESLVGSLDFVLIQVEPLTEARVAAIRSDPSAIKAVRLQLRCNHCNDAIQPYAGLERSAKQEEEGCIWYQTLPNSFVCRCGKLSVDLTIIRTNLHGLLGQRPTTSHHLSYVQAYEREALHTIRTNFRALLDLGAGAAADAYRQMFNNRYGRMMMTAPVVKFQMLLRELFQFDCADLDFGISCSASNASFHFEAVIALKVPCTVIAKEHRD